MELFQALLVRNCKLLATLGTAASQYFAAILVCHARTEAVLVGALSLRRLIRPFHFGSSFLTSFQMKGKGRFF
jgi:hypothetical protein